MRFSINTIILIILSIGALSLFGYIIFLIIKALKTYIRSRGVREEKIKTAKTLGEVLKAHRVKCKMTQEFVAEAIGVSRQAVSKWESGATDPSTTNLMALAKLFGLSPEELIKETQEQSDA
ncbi:MAG: helix-turn-helix transcriptional regulator [Ruminococcaceae bacterium]|nr:helix-turn-helix transcriptional regulator [Oscillospiraceae bacterium]